MFNLLWNLNLSNLVRERDYHGDNLIQNLAEIKSLSKSNNAEIEAIKLSNELKQKTIETSNYADEKLALFRQLNKDPAHIIAIHKLQMQHSQSFDEMEGLTQRKIYHSPDKLGQKLKDNIGTMQQIIELNCHIVQKLHTRINEMEVKSIDDDVIVKRNNDHPFPTS